MLAFLFIYFFTVDVGLEMLIVSDCLSMKFFHSGLSKSSNQTDLLVISCTALRGKAMAEELWRAML